MDEEIFFSSSEDSQDEPILTINWDTIDSRPSSENSADFEPSEKDSKVKSSENSQFNSSENLTKKVKPSEISQYSKTDCQIKSFENSQSKTSEKVKLAKQIKFSDSDSTKTAKNGKEGIPLVISDEKELVIEDASNVKGVVEEISSQKTEV